MAQAGKPPPAPPGGPHKPSARPPTTLVEMPPRVIPAAGPRPGPAESEASRTVVNPGRAEAKPGRAEAKPSRAEAKPSRAEAKPSRAEPTAQASRAEPTAQASRVEATAQPSRVEAKPSRAGIRVETTAGPGPARPDGRISLFRETLLGSALVAGTIGAALPGLLLCWLTFARLVEGGTSALLQHTGGLEPTTFGGGYWMSLGVNAGIVLWSVVRRLRGTPAPWRPLVVLISAYVLALWLVVSIDACQLADVPDVLTTFALLGADVLVQYLLPAVLLVLLLQGAAYLWRKGRIALPAASRITAVAGCLGLAGVTAAGMLVVAGSGAALAAIGDRVADVRAADLGGVASARQRYERLAANPATAGTPPCR